MTIHIPFGLMIALIPVVLLLFFEQLWVHYLAVMLLKRVDMKTGLKPGSRFFGYWLVLPIGLAYDLTGNLLCTLIFFDVPRSWVWVSMWRLKLPVFPLELISGRLQRYLNDSSQTWRKRWAWAFAEDMLNPYDEPFGHIHKP